MTRYKFTNEDIPANEFCVWEFVDLKFMEEPVDLDPAEAPMTREHRRAKWQALRLTARLKAAGHDTPRVVVSHDPACGIHTHKLCSCDPLIIGFTTDGEAYVLDERGALYRLERQ